jgi:hypothetical protein
VPTALLRPFAFAANANSACCGLIRIACTRAAAARSAEGTGSGLAAVRRGIAGEVQNLMASDAARMVECAMILHRVWTAPFVLIAGITCGHSPCDRRCGGEIRIRAMGFALRYIYAFIGPAVFAGVALMTLFAPTALAIGKKNVRASVARAHRTVAWPCALARVAAEIPS